MVSTHPDRECHSSTSHAHSFIIYSVPNIEVVPINKGHAPSLLTIVHDKGWG